MLLAYQALISLPSLSRKAKHRRAAARSQLICLLFLNELLYIYVCVYIYIYIHIEKERERERDIDMYNVSRISYISLSTRMTERMITSLRTHT